MNKDSKGRNSGKPTPNPIPSNISDVSLQKVEASKAFLEDHYRVLLLAARNGGVRNVGPRERQLTANDFQLLKCIGRGAFGEVYVCRRIGNNNELYALKRLRKADMIKKKQVVHIRSEKDVLSEASTKNPWIVRLYASFQDEQYLYMVMEYMPGGDMISWLCEKGVFDVESTRFYIAELCVAVNSVHEMFFVHRDIKPDNILFGEDGHIKLSDFGLSKRFAQSRDDEPLLLDFNDETNSNRDLNETTSDTGGTKNRNSPSQPSSAFGKTNQPIQDETEQGLGVSETRRNVFMDPSSSNVDPVANSNPLHLREMFQSIVGSAGYIAPEILKRQPYGVSCDWWSVGVIVYEMLYGIPPFYSPNANTTCHKIVHWRKYLCFPSDKGVPEDAVDFISKLLCDPKDRMTFAEIARHPFLQSLDLDHLHELKAAYTPILSNPLDTRYFPEIDETTLSRSTADDKSMLQGVDPCGVMFADFKFNCKS